jgi:hypothetical protein
MLTGLQVVIQLVNVNMQTCELKLLSIVLLSADISARTILFSLDLTAFLICHCSVSFCAAFGSAYMSLFCTKTSCFSPGQITRDDTFTNSSLLIALTLIGNGSLLRIRDNRYHRKEHNYNYLFHKPFRLFNALTAANEEGLMDL